MIALELLDTKDFMNKLLLTPIFDHFCFIEAVIVTFQTVKIDGKINRDYYSSEELNELPPHSFWENIRPFCLQLVKGKRTPLNFRITLSLSPKNIANVLQSSRLDFTLEQVKGLLLNFKFDGKKITCITGTSLNIFTMDKRLEQEWDSLAEKFLKKNQIISTHLK